MSRSSAGRLSAEQAAKRVLGQLPTVTAPVPVEELVRRLGIGLVFESLGPEVSGLIVRTAAAAVKICVNSDDPPVRRRFTMAHELGHHVLGHLPGTDEHVHVDRGNVILYRSKRVLHFAPMEVAANRFAAEVLMPPALVRAEARRRRPEGPLTDRDVLTLAAKFEVSEQAMTIQLGRSNLL